MNLNVGYWIIEFAVLVLAATVYMVPSFVAVFRHHHKQTAILALNVLLGWTLIGWVAALAWAFTKVKQQNTSAS